MRILIVLAAVTSLAFIDARGSAQAQYEPWCAWKGGNAQYCGLYTYKQCLEYIRGVGGYCARNPWYDPRRSQRRRRD